MKQSFLRLVSVLILSYGFVASASAQVNLDFAMPLNDGDGYSHDYVNAFAVDAAGNIYVTGGTPPTSGNIEDAMTIKYNANGVEQWRARYNGGYGSDWGQSIVVDGSGNVFVGMTSRGASNTDYFIIKYNSSGDSLWTKRYDGPEASFDYIKSIRLNSLGYLCATGLTSKAATGNDIWTIFVDASNGDVILQETYNGSGNTHEEVTGLGMDGAGNFYVSGTAASSGAFTATDFVTLKYDNNGNWQWTKLYNGPSNYRDVPSAITVDESGFIYVTGESWSGAAGNSDFLTIKYNSTGDSLWVKRYDFDGDHDLPRAITVDDSGNVIVAGYVTDLSSQKTDAIVIRYTAAGDTAWTRRHTADDGLSQRAYGVGTDNLENVYVAGYQEDAGPSYPVFMIRYTPDGVQDKGFNFGGTDVYTNTVVGMTTTDDGTSTIFATTVPQGASMGNWLVLRFYADDELVNWSQIYDSGLNAVSSAMAIALDDSGNVYATGTTFTTSGYDNITTAKINALGDTVWVRYYNGGSTDMGEAITVDASGNVYVAGSTYQSSRWQIVTIKYSPDGVQQWAQMYTSGSGAGDVPYAITMNGTRVLVTGYSYLPATSNDFLTIQYTSGGATVGTARRFNPGGSSYDDQARRILAAGQDTFYVVGRASSTSSNMNMAVVKYAGISGTQQWSFQYSGVSTFGHDEATGVCRDSAGNIYVSGYSWSAAGWVEGLTQSNYDIVVLKMTSDGDTLWSSVFRGPSNRNDYAFDMAYDGHGGIYIAGMTENGTDSDIILVRMDTSGTVLWDVTYDRPDGNNNEIPTGLAVDTAGNAYVTGSGWPRWTATFVPSVDILVLRFDRETGGLDWSTFYNGTANNSYEENGRAIAVDESGNVYVAGVSINSMSGLDFTVLRYSQSIPLPVQLSTFTATANGTSAELKWRTESEVENHGFEIERRRLRVPGCGFRIQTNTKHPTRNTQPNGLGLASSLAQEPLLPPGITHLSIDPLSPAATRTASSRSTTRGPLPIPLPWKLSWAWPPSCSPLPKTIRIRLIHPPPSSLLFLKTDM